MLCFIFLDYDKHIKKYQAYLFIWLFPNNRIRAYDEHLRYHWTLFVYSNNNNIGVNGHSHYKKK